MEKLNSLNKKNNFKKTIIKCFFILVIILVFIIVSLYIIGYTSIKNKFQEKNKVQELDRNDLNELVGGFISKSDYEKKHNQTSDDLSLNNLEYEEITYEIFKINYPKTWHTSKDANGFNIFSQPIDNTYKNVGDFLNQNVIITIGLNQESYAQQRTLDEYMEKVYGFLSKNFEQKSLNNNICYRYINEKPQTEFYYHSNYDGTEIGYVCEYKNGIKYDVSMESANPQKFEKIFEYIAHNIEFTN